MLFDIGSYQQQQPTQSTSVSWIALHLPTVRMNAYGINGVR
ncbi:hypothetical protein BLOT_010452 [Blomia tropicalis]|nr:hypothetical protein BLOT_010452 [Blomia tropicalis]